MLYAQWLHVIHALKYSTNLLAQRLSHIKNCLLRSIRSKSRNEMFSTRSSLSPLAYFVISYWLNAFTTIDHFVKGEILIGTPKKLFQTYFKTNVALTLWKDMRVR